MGRLAFFKRRLEETTVIEPFLIHHITIQVIVQYLHFLIILGVEDKGFIVTQRITFHHFTDYLSKPFTTFTHVSRTGTDIIGSTVSKVNHGQDILRSSSAATNRLLLFISTMTPSGEDNTSCATCHADGIFFSSMVSGMKLGTSVQGSNLRGG